MLSSTTHAADVWSINQPDLLNHFLLIRHRTEETNTHTHSGKGAATPQRSGGNYERITGERPGFGEVSWWSCSQLRDLILCLEQVKTLCQPHGSNQRSLYAS